MLEEIANKISSAQTKRPAAFITLFLVLTALLIPGILLLIGNVEPSLEKVLPQHVEEIELMNQLRSDLGADMMYVVIDVEGPVMDVRTPESLRYANQLSERIRTVPHVREVQSSADLVKRSFGGIPDDAAALRQLMDGREQEFLISPDARLMVIALRTDTGANAGVIKEVVLDVQDAIRYSEPENPGFRTRLTGYNAIDRATFNVIMQDFARITVVSFALITLLVFITFRKPRKALMPLVVVMVAVLWTTGIAGYLGLTVTVVSMVSVAMVLGLGIDFGIHVTYLYSHLREKYQKRRALKEMLQELLRAMIGGSLTTTAGFLALLFGVLPAMKTLGIILAIGILSTLIGAVFLLPAILYITDTTTGGT